MSADPTPSVALVLAIFLQEFWAKARIASIVSGITIA
jgi:hypothetical protein